MNTTESHKAPETATRNTDGSEVTLRLVPRETAVRFKVGHLFGLGSVSGTLALTDGTVRASLEDNAVHSIDVTLSARSFSTGNRARDNAVVSARFLNIQNHDSVRFTSHEIVGTPDGFRATGHLTLHGTSAPVELMFTVPDATDPLRLSATARIDRYAHGLTQFRGMAGRFVAVTIDTRAELIR